MTQTTKIISLAKYPSDQSNWSITLQISLILNPAVKHIVGITKSNTIKPAKAVLGRVSGGGDKMIIAAL